MYIFFLNNRRMGRTKSVSRKQPRVSQKTVYTKYDKKPTKKSALATPGVKKAYRFKPGTVALREIRKFQKSTDLLLRRTPFIRLVKGIVDGLDVKYKKGGKEETRKYNLPTTIKDVRLQEKAVGTLMVDTEAKMVSDFEDANLSAIHAKRVTVGEKDLNLVDRIKYDIRN
jgi:histone H3